MSLFFHFIAGFFCIALIVPDTSIHSQIHTHNHANHTANHAQIEPLNKTAGSSHIICSAIINQYIAADSVSAIHNIVTIRNVELDFESSHIAFSDLLAINHSQIHTHNHANHTANHAAIAACHDIAHASFHNSISATTSQYIAADSTKARNNTINVIIFHLFSGFFCIASIAHDTNIHSQIPTHNHANHTANHAPIVISDIIEDGSIPMICSAIINQYIAADSVNAIHNTVIIRNVELDFESSHIAFSDLLAINHSQIHTHNHANHTANHAAIAACHDIAHASFHNSISATTSQYIAADSTKARNNTINVIIFHLFSGFFCIASIAHDTNIHSQIPTHNHANHTANHAPIVISDIIEDGSIPMICSAIINQYIAADSVNAIHNTVITKKLELDSGLLHIACKDFLAINHSQIHTHNHASHTANHAAIAACHDIAHASFHNSISATTSQYIAADSTKARNNTINVIIFHLFSGFFCIASIAHDTNIHSQIPTHNHANHTANHAPIVISDIIEDGSIPMICSAIINQYIAADSVNAIHNTVITKKLELDSGLLHIACKDFLAINHSQIHTHNHASHTANHAAIAACHDIAHASFHNSISATTSQYIAADSTKARNNTINVIIFHLFSGFFCIASIAHDTSIHSQIHTHNHAQPTASHAQIATPGVSIVGSNHNICNAIINQYIAADSVNAIHKIVRTKIVPLKSGFLPIISSDFLAIIHSQIHTHNHANHIANHAHIYNSIIII